MVTKIEVRKIEITKGKSTEIRFIHAISPKDFCVLILPALGVNASSYDRLLRAFAKEGNSAAVIDLQGQGTSSIIATRNHNIGYHELLTEDIPAAVNETAAIFHADIVLLGHSLGGQIGSLYCTQKDKRIAGLILATSGSVFFRCWSGWERVRVLTGTQFARLYALIAGYFPGKKFGFGDRTFQRLINDWGHQALTGNYKIKGSYVDWEEALQQMTMPVLAIHLRVDFLAPPNAVKHLCQKFPNAPLTDCCLDIKHLNHFTWVKHAQSFMSEISKWLLDLKTKNDTCKYPA